jgi:hypothetical protein
LHHGRLELLSTCRAKGKETMNIRLFPSILLACLFSHATPVVALANLPLRFEPARDPGDHVKFVAHGQGYTLFLVDSGAILKSGSATLNMRMTGGSPSPGLAAGELLPGVTNYLIGNDPSRWRTGMAGFARIEYRAIYPGIDLVYYGDQGQLEYDFVVAPGADPRQIRIAFDGATSLRVDKDGDLLLRASGESWRFRKPVLYQRVRGEKQPIAGHYTLHGRQVRFTVSSYDVSLPLVIDPVLVYSTLFGGSKDAILGIATDAAGNAYLAGQTVGFIPLMNPEQPQFNGSFLSGIPNAFITKINAAGTALIYSTFIGGSGGDRADSIAVDPAGNAYITGYTSSADFPTVNPIQPKAKATNAFVTKLNAAGNALVYST